MKSSTYRSSVHDEKRVNLWVAIRLFDQCIIVFQEYPLFVEICHPHVRFRRMSPCAAVIQHALVIFERKMIWNWEETRSLLQRSYTLTGFVLTGGWGLIHLSPQPSKPTIVVKM